MFSWLNWFSNGNKSAAADGLLLILDRSGIQVTLDSASIIIRGPKGGIQRVALHLVEGVIIYGNALVACDVWRALAKNNIPMTLLPQRGQDESAWISGSLQVTLHYRRAQHTATPATALNLARHLVANKLTNMATLLQSLEQKQDIPVLITPLPAISTTLKRIKTAIKQLDSCNNIACLMGHEGTASAAWFGWLATALKPHWRFSGRNRRPPLDPFNAVLSLGYTLLTGEMQQAVMLCGLDPALGFLHQEYPGRYALVLDCIEPLRTGIDAFSLNLLDKVLQPSHFRTHKDEGCRLTNEGRAVYYAQWAIVRNSWPIYDGSMTNLEQQRSLRSQCMREVKRLRELLPTYTPKANI